MSGEIVNRVANSSLIIIDLEDYAPTKSIAVLDIKKFLFKEIFLKEKELDKSVKYTAAKVRQCLTMALMTKL